MTATSSGRNPCWGTSSTRLREHLGKSLAGVVAGLKFNNTVKKGDIDDLNADLKQLSQSVEKSELSVGDYIAAKDYLSQVGAAVRALGDPNVANYFNHKFNAKNVAELVDDMRTKGLDFAAAAPGDEGAYRCCSRRWWPTITPSRRPSRRPRPSRRRKGRPAIPDASSSDRPSEPGA